LTHSFTSASDPTCAAGAYAAVICTRAARPAGVRAWVTCRVARVRARSGAHLIGLAPAAVPYPPAHCSPCSPAPASPSWLSKSGSGGRVDLEAEDGLAGRRAELEAAARGVAWTRGAVTPDSALICIHRLRESLRRCSLTAENDSLSSLV
jgi:hypothetical protein